jgi:hypothetical protein
MKTRYFLLLAAMGLLASCAKEMQEPIESPVSDADQIKTVLTVGIDTETKTTLGAGVGGTHKVYWSNGDKIAVNGTASDALSGLGDDVVSTKFTFSGSLTTPYKVLYPSSIYKDASHVTLPAVQTYKADGFADGMFPMAGYSADGSGIKVSHLCAIVKVSVLRATTSADEDNLVSVRFKGRNNEQVSGEFTIDYENATLAGASSDEADKVVKVVKSLETSTTTAAVYYIVVPAGNYSSGFDITVQDKNGHYMTKSKTSSWTAEAGKLYNMPEFTFVPTGTELGIEISNAQQLIAFATAYNNEEYVALGDGLVATLTSNITFDATTSADYNTTGGIGSVSSENYFHGCFNGNGKTISGFVATVPLFANIGSSGIVKNLTVDSSCSFTFTHPTSSEGRFGSIAGYNKGNIKDVTVNANVTVTSASGLTKETSLGGIVGREQAGTIENCTYAGALTIPSTFGSAETKIYIGGIVGRISNTDGKVLSSIFNGTLENEGQMVASSETDDLKSEPYLMIGGIAGLNTGTINSCSTTNHATGITVTLNDGSDHDYNGTIVTHSTNAYHYAIAGIVGRNDGTVSSCTNNANLLNVFSAERGTGGNLNGRYLHYAGVVAYNNSGATVSGSKNYGEMIDRANPKMHYVGGIVGSNLGTVSSCENLSTKAISVGTSHSSPYGPRQLYLGGVIGWNYSSSNISTIKNTAGINVSRVENNANAGAYIGGLIGRNEKAIDGGTTKWFNTGSISYTSSCANPTKGLYIGGILGETTANVKNVENQGNVQIGKLTTAIPNITSMGGVIGYCSSNVTLSGCSNSGSIFTGQSTTSGSGFTATDVAFRLGGIIGCLSGDSSIDDCHNTGLLYINGSNNTDDPIDKAFMEGGIVGLVKGTSSNPISITNCSWTYTTVDVGARRGTCGGVAGYAEYTNITNCDVTVNYNKYNHYTGGIAGWVVNSTLKNCKFKGTKIAATTGIGSGGIVARLTSGSVIDGCSNYATAISAGSTTTAIGEIAAISEAGTIIKNCHHTGTIAICSDTNFTDGGGNDTTLP